MKKENVMDAFTRGAKEGWEVGIYSMLPNVLMAFVLIEFLKLLGILAILGKVFAPVMIVFGLPGESIMVLVSAFLSMGGGVGVVTSLVTSGILDEHQVTILLPAIFLMGSLMQYMGRCLGTSGVQTRFYPVMFAICFINAIVAMFIIKIFS